jgi:hypothetical protein
MEPIHLVLIGAFIAQAATVIGAWVRVQKDITEVKTDIGWLKQHAQQRRSEPHG